MRYAILSDIHGNLEAATAVLEALEGMEIDAYLCLGDIVGYGANPNESIDLVRDLSARVVCGNHDAAALDPPQRKYFNPLARSAIEWTDERIQGDNREYLAALPMVESVNGALLVHASPSEPRAWCYVTDVVSAAHEFSAFEESLCFIGHSHIPLVVALKGDGITRQGATEISLLPDTRYIVNVGSIGQPRDGDPRAAFGVLDTDAATVSLLRVEYDVHTAREKILDSGLPALLGDRLLVGQ